MLLAS
jgi:hypothetical protein